MFRNGNEQGVKHYKRQSDHQVLEGVDTNFADELNEQEDKKCQSNDHHSVFTASFSFLIIIDGYDQIGCRRQNHSDPVVDQKTAVRIDD